MSDWVDLCEAFGLSPGAQWEEVEARLFRSEGPMPSYAEPPSSVLPVVPLRSDCGSIGDLSLDLGSGGSMRLVKIKPGTFIFGSPANEFDQRSNQTQHSVTISKPFWLGQTAVTQAQWQAVMGSNPSRFRSPSADVPAEQVLKRPVDNVGLKDAQEFCRRLSEATGMSLRLPTETEWEYACRAGTQTAFSFGDDPDQLVEYAWFHNNSNYTTHPVATKKPNAWGLYDMHGNMFEWCVEWFDGNPSRASADLPGPMSRERPVLRGGCWDSGFGLCRASGGIEESRHFNLCGGFRVARTSASDSWQATSR